MDPKPIAKHISSCHKPINWSIHLSETKSQMIILSIYMCCDFLNNKNTIKPVYKVLSSFFSMTAVSRLPAVSGSQWSSFPGLDVLFREMFGCHAHGNALRLGPVPTDSNRNRWRWRLYIPGPMFNLKPRIYMSLLFYLGSMLRCLTIYQTLGVFYSDFAEHGIQKHDQFMMEWAAGEDKVRI